MLLDNKLDFWFKNNRNVLFVGKHGVGKTSQIKSCFERNGLEHGKNYLYFSASTLDPWVDLVGVPEKTVSPDGSAYLELVRPKALANGEVVAIFFDEFNRAPKKVRNAVMELMQFRSINGLVFPNLKCIWAAVNPEDGEYDVEKIDPAQKDRFHIIQEIAYKPNRDWFAKKFDAGTADAAIEWWNDLPYEEKDKVSPRRLEYALDEFFIGGSVQDVLPVSCNVNKLLQGLKNGPIENKLKNLFEIKDIGKAKAFLANDNNYHGSLKHILADQSYIEFFVPLMPKEQLVTLMSENTNVCKFITQESNKNNDLWNLMREIVMAGQDEKLVKMFTRYVNIDSAILIKETPPEAPEKPLFAKNPKKLSFSNYNSLTNLSHDQAEKCYEEIISAVEENISDNDALSCLLALASITKNFWATTLLKPEFKTIVGVINHCLLQIKKADKQTNILQCIMQEHRDLHQFFTKLQQANLFGKVVRV